MRRPAALLLALALSGAGACAIRTRARSAAEGLAARHEASLKRGVCVLMFDGLSDENFRRLVAEGSLPAIRAELLDRGLAFEVAVGSLPTETYPNMAALLSGLFPGHHGIPANVWLDRRLRRREQHTHIFRTFAISDFLDPDAQTLFERLPSDTVVVTAPIARGAAVASRNLVAVTAAYLRNDWPSLDRKTLDDVGDAYAGSAAVGRVPSLVFAHLLGPDEAAHFDGPESEAFRATMKSVDRAFARLVKRLKRSGQYDQVLFVLVGDHGNSSYARVVNVEELVHRALYSHPTAADCNRAHCVLVPASHAGDGAFDVGGAEIAVGAYRGAMIWLPTTRPAEEIPKAFATRKPRKPPRPRRGGTPRAAAPNPWIPPTARSEFAAALARSPDVRLVATRGPEPGQVVVYAGAGRALAARVEDESGPLYTYHVLEGTDPLGYAASPEAAPLLGSLASADAWLEATAATAFPDVVVQLVELFDSPRAPDVYVTPSEGRGFTPARAAGHGAVARREMVVPLVFAGPGVAPGRRHVARTVDLAPTILSYLGVPYDAESLDGRDLAVAASGDGDGR